MKRIAIPVNENNHIEDHFGHCEFYEIYSVVDDNLIVDVQKIASESGCGCKSNIANVLAENGVTLMLAGGIGQGAVNTLNLCNIDVIKGCSGETSEIIKEYLKGNIVDSGNTCGHHHQHHHQGHKCNH